MSPPASHDPAPRTDLLGAALRLLVIGLLLYGVGMVLRPFLPAIIWSVVIVVATWPLLEALQRRLHGRRVLAEALLSLGLLAVVVAPIAALLATLVARLPELRDLLLRWLQGPWPGPPDWLVHLPYGAELATQWQSAAARTSQEWSQWLAPWAGKAALWLSARLGTVGSILFEFLLTLVLVVVFYRHGAALAQHVYRLAQRIGGVRGEESLRLAVGAVRAIAAGVVLTALAQSLLGGLALLIVGAQAVALLTAAMFLLCVVQLGPLPVLVPVILWQYATGHPVGGTFLVAWSVVLSVGDGLMRPMLMRRGAQLPFLLITGGVVGGLLAFGVAGLFAGPILLAVVLRLLERWVSEGDAGR
jgi:predicted PurR-regulated permease PerM